MFKDTFIKKYKNENLKKKSNEDLNVKFEKVIYINRCSKVLKGGRRFSFSALVVIGDLKNKIGIGYGKANEVPNTIKKATEAAKKNIHYINLKNNTIPYEIMGKQDGALVFFKPASKGTGVIASNAIRTVLESIGIKDILTKSLGSNNPIAVVRATLNGLKNFKTSNQILTLRKIKGD